MKRLFAVALGILSICNVSAKGQDLTSVKKKVADRPVIGEMPLQDANWKLAQMGAIPASQAQKNAQVLKDANGSVAVSSFGDLFGLHKPDPIWKGSSHQFGYLAVGTDVASSVDTVSILQIGSAPHDDTLKTSGLTIRLDRIRVASYPGKGRHNVLFTFKTQNKTTTGTEDVAFSQNYEIEDGQGSGIAGYVIFSGLHLPDTGLNMECHTTNVSNDNDVKVLSYLNGSSFQKGLTLLNTLNPVIPVVSGFAVGLVNDFESRNENVGVQDFFLGLDFGASLTGGRLSQGSYIVVQAPDENWSWGDWIFSKSKGQVVSKKDGTPIPFNYVIFSIQSS